MSETRRATLYRMVMPQHICPWGLKAKYFLEREGFTVDDHWLRTREETEAFKKEHGVSTTPQTFIDGKRIGGYEDLRRALGKPLPDPKAITYRPVVALFAITALMALAVSMDRLWDDLPGAAGVHSMIQTLLERGRRDGLSQDHIFLTGHGKGGALANLCAVRAAGITTFARRPVARFMIRTRRQ